MSCVERWVEVGREGETRVVCVRSAGKKKCFDGSC